MPESLAVRRAGLTTAITRVHEVLDAFAARDHTGEILTAIRHFPAREAQWADFPAWVNADLASAYAAKGICGLMSVQAAYAFGSVGGGEVGVDPGREVRPLRFAGGKMTNRGEDFAGVVASGKGVQHFVDAGDGG